MKFPPNLKQPKPPSYKDKGYQSHPLDHLDGGNSKSLHRTAHLVTTDEDISPIGIVGISKTTESPFDSVSLIIDRFM